MRNPQVKQLLLLAVVFSAVVFQSALLPVIASNVLHSGAAGFGLLQSAGGPGAILGAMLAGELVTDRRRRMALIGGSLIMGGGYLLVAVSRALWLTAAGVGVFGFSFFLVNAVGQTVLLTASPDEYRGRVMGLFVDGHGGRNTDRRAHRRGPGLVDRSDAGRWGSRPDRAGVHGLVRRLRRLPGHWRGRPHRAEEFGGSVSGGGCRQLGRGDTGASGGS